MGSSRPPLILKIPIPNAIWITCRNTRARRRWNTPFRIPLDLAAPTPRSFSAAGRANSGRISLPPRVPAFFSRPRKCGIPKGSLLVNIIVCIKQVPAKDAPLAIAGNWIKESDIGFEMNEPDSYALEEALRLKEKHGGDVVALSMCLERVKQTIKEALAQGAYPRLQLFDG